MTENEIEKIEEIFKHQLGIFTEDVQHKFDLVIEGQQMLAEQTDRMGSELKSDIDRVDRRVTGVAADLSGHRRDTEVHRGYGVREE